jgi:hypothetical protein
MVACTYAHILCCREPNQQVQETASSPMQTGHVGSKESYKQNMAHLSLHSGIDVVRLTPQLNISLTV